MENSSLHHFYALIFFFVKALRQWWQIREAMKRWNVDYGKKLKQWSDEAFNTGIEIEAMKRLMLHRIITSVAQLCFRYSKLRASSSELHNPPQNFERLTAQSPTNFGRHHPLILDVILLWAECIILWATGWCLCPGKVNCSNQKTLSVGNI